MTQFNFLPNLLFLRIYNLRVLKLSQSLLCLKQFQEQTEAVSNLIVFKKDNAWFLLAKLHGDFPWIFATDSNGRVLFGYFHDLDKMIIRICYLEQLNTKLPLLILKQRFCSIVKIPTEMHFYEVDYKLPFCFLLYPLCLTFCFWCEYYRLWFE